MEKHRSENAPVSGFFIGFLLGVIAALLLKSKQGRRILKNIIESGIEKFGDVEDVIKNSVDINDDLIDGDDFLMPHTSSESKQEKLQEEKPKTELAENLDDESDLANEPSVDIKSASVEAVTAVKSATRRFFKGIKKRG